MQANYFDKSEELTNVLILRRTLLFPAALCTSRPLRRTAAAAAAATSDPAATAGQREANGRLRLLEYDPLIPEPTYDCNTFIYKEFYVDPDSNILVRNVDLPSKRKTKGMSKAELRKFREAEKKSKLAEKQLKKAEEKKITQKTKQILTERKNK